MFRKFKKNITVNFFLIYEILPLKIIITFSIMLLEAISCILFYNCSTNIETKALATKLKIEFSSITYEITCCFVQVSAPPPPPKINIDCKLPSRHMDSTLLGEGWRTRASSWFTYDVCLGFIVHWNLDITIWQGHSTIISLNRDVVVNKLPIYK